MKDNSLVVLITCFDDVKKITENTKYINIDIANPSHDIVEFFTEHGQMYKYSDYIDGVYGYTYVNYDEFIKAENIIDMIYANMPNNLNQIEIARYLYIALGKCISFDINTDTNKCELYDLSLITNINNLWGSIAFGKATNISASKIYYYLCSRMGIDAYIENNDNNYYVNLKIKNKIINTNIFLDIPFISAMLQTKYFGTYNDDDLIDKKINYITSKYNDYYLDKALKDIDYISDSFIWKILEKTQDILDINNIRPMELGIIYEHIFKKYAPNYDIKISNLFLNDSEKYHFIVISCNDIHYSFNYKKNSFVIVKESDIIDNLNIGKIGLYLNEIIPNVNYTSHLLC